MSATMLVVGPKLAVALVVLTVTAAAVAIAGKLGHGRQIAVAAIRAAIQLAAVSLLIAAIVASLWATAGFVVVMCAVAAGTSSLVTLPGAFVGVLLGGATPLAAGITQLFVLVGLLAVEAVAVVLTVELVARGRFTSPTP